jgi:hypothetical protein
MSCGVGLRPSRLINPSGGHLFTKSIYHESLRVIDPSISCDALADNTQKTHWQQLLTMSWNLILPSWRLHGCLVFLHQHSKIRHFQQYFNYIMAVSFTGERNRITRRKPSTCRKSLTKFITYYCIKYIDWWRIGWFILEFMSLYTVVHSQFMMNSKFHIHLSASELLQAN